MKNCPRFTTGFSLGASLLCASVLMTPSAAFAGGFNPPATGSPGNREAGAARSDTCVSTVNGNGVTALLPSSSIVGLTTQDSPKIFAYIPPNNAEKAEFRLLEEKSSKELFVGQVQMPKAESGKDSYKYKASVVGISLPANAVEKLQPGNK